MPSELSSRTIEVHHAQMTSPRIHSREHLIFNHLFCPSISNAAQDTASPLNSIVETNSQNDPFFTPSRHHSPQWYKRASFHRNPIALIPFPFPQILQLNLAFQLHLHRLLARRLSAANLRELASLLCRRPLTPLRCCLAPGGLLQCCGRATPACLAYHVTLGRLLCHGGCGAARTMLLLRAWRE